MYTYIYTYIYIYMQVSAFYKSDVQINYLAELVDDNSSVVREHVVFMLREFMTEMGDRYDFDSNCFH
jgi:hypothetical protein